MATTQNHPFAAPLPNPYAAPRAVLADEPSRGEEQLASRYRRLRATVIDVVIFVGSPGTELEFAL